MYYALPGTEMRVMGSMHLLPAGSPNIPDWTLKAYEWSEVLVFESDPPGILSQLRAPFKCPLQDLLSPSAWNALQSVWPSPPNFHALESVQPWAALLFASAFSAKTAEGIEPKFLRWAGQSSKSVHFLETAERLATTFDSAPLRDVVQAIELLTRDLSEPQRSLESMYKAWVAKDLSALGEIAFRSPTFQSPAVRDAVLRRRNEGWAPKLLELLRSSKRTLVAVGALHLYGPDNLFSYLGRDVQLLV